ncbi:MAG: NAD-dependent epimerase/dehydratase family protein [Lacibacter sp.]|nr:NAD-dependent epimerase/dehydratase family protein [Lacibacter sp.]
MSVLIVTGAAGLIGSEAVNFFAPHFDLVIGIDNNMRQYFFGENASVQWKSKQLVNQYQHYKHKFIDIRDAEALEQVFALYNSSIKLVIHAAAQPSHDWAAKEPFTDFSINATGTLNMLEQTRKYCPDAVFIFTSTNKVYGDNPNQLPLVEEHTRWEIDQAHPFYHKGINETMSIDQCKHSLFGVSKLSADIMVQEYGKYFGMKTGVFRGGCLTGPNHTGMALHGFLSYLAKCTLTGKQYTIYGYNGKQVRDNIHSHDLITMFQFFYANPKIGEVYNAGGGRFANCSLIEAIQLCENVSGNKLNYIYSNSNRSGDHIWYISDTTKFETDYPQWKRTYDLTNTVEQILKALESRL